MKISVHKILRMLTAFILILLSLFAINRLVNAPADAAGPLGDAAPTASESHEASASNFSVSNGELEVDIKPGNELNTIYPDLNGAVLIAILSSPGFDAPAEIEVDSIRLEGAGVHTNASGVGLCKSKDANRDGTDDLVCSMPINQFKSRSGYAVANVIARTIEGNILTGQDEVRLVLGNMGIGGMRALHS